LIVDEVIGRLVPNRRRDLADQGMEQPVLASEGRIDGRLGAACGRDDLVDGRGAVAAR
jgi:hypothetical protein